jgi:hypothetical protein
MKMLISYPEVQAAVDELNKQFAVHYQDCQLPEACGPINDASRNIIRAVIKVCGHAYVAQINRDEEERKQPLFRMIENADEVKNFGATYVLAEPDPEMERLMLEREASPYTGMRDDAARIDAIAERAIEIGAIDLIWT